MLTHNPLKKLLVTLASSNHVNQAKQVFSSAHFNAGWDGDFMLLGVDLDPAAISWFKNKGIHVRICAPIRLEEIREFETIALAKFYVFKKEFTQWDTIIFVDADVIIQGSLEAISKRKGFNAWVPEYICPLFGLLRNFGVVNENLDPQLKQGMLRLKSSYPIYASCFSSGAFEFSTDIIKDDTFDALCALSQAYYKYTAFLDMLALNLYFYKKWKRLPLIYHIYLTLGHPFLKINPNACPGIILHFPGTDKEQWNDKPWNPGHPFYGIWKANFDRSESIDVRVVRQAKLATWFDRMLITVQWYWLNSFALSKKTKKYTQTTLKLFLNDQLPGFYAMLRKVKRGLHPMGRRR